jgi:protein-tyrosine phosphatase
MAITNHKKRARSSETPAQRQLRLHTLEQVEPYVWLSNFSRAEALAQDPTVVDPATGQAERIECVINVASRDEAHRASTVREFKRRRIEHHHLPILDHPSEDIVTHAETAVLPVLRRQVALRRHTVVHCWEGRSRSVACVLAHLIADGGMRFDAALAQAKQARKVCEPNRGFVRQLRRMEQQQLGRARVDC